MFLSFIIPVYNTEAYLDDCLGSMLNQDIPAEDYEIVCVNDGSTDGSLRLLRRYEEQYPNVVVVDQENSGVCKARNAGLAAARGEYIWYFDADDYVAANCLKGLKEKCASTGCDRLVIGNYQFLTGSAEPMLENTSWKDSVVWRSILRRAFLLEHDLWFHYPELTFGEDALYMFEVKHAAPVTVELPDLLYFHRNRPGSLSTEASAKMDLIRLRCALREAEILKGYYEKEEGAMVTETANRFMSFLWGSLFRILLMPAKEAKSFLKECRQKGLYPYPTPRECTLTRYPDITRTDLLGKLMDRLYTNLGSPWAYHSMRLLQFLFRLKYAIKK